MSRNRTAAAAHRRVFQSLAELHTSPAMVYYYAYFISPGDCADTTEFMYNVHVLLDTYKVIYIYIYIRVRGSSAPTEIN